MIGFFLGCLFYVAVHCLLGIWRTQQACEYLECVLDEIYLAASVDINKGRSWKWRYAGFKAVRREVYRNAYMFPWSHPASTLSPSHIVDLCS